MNILKAIFALIKNLAHLPKANKLIAMPSLKSLQRRPPARYNATIMFLDIRGFSLLFDQHDPIEVLSFANSVLSELGMVVEACGGVVDKFTGDGFLAHFGVLEESKSHVEDACWCAVRLRTCVQQLNLKRYFDQQHVISVGIGIHTGTVAGGVITTSVKEEFTVLGDVVNLAARIESLTKEFTVDCIVSKAVFDTVNSHFAFQKMPYREIRGSTTPQETYWLLPTNLFL